MKDRYFLIVILLATLLAFGVRRLLNAVFHQGDALVEVAAVSNEKQIDPPAKTPPLDWPALYGSAAGRVAETGLLSRWGGDGPAELRRKKIGAGYSQPIIVAGKLFLFHRIGGEEIISCEDAETGKELWRFAYPTQYVDRYGYSNGPRSTPLAVGDQLFALGAEGKLHCLQIANGTKRWARDLNRDFEVEQGFFGVGASPIWSDGAIVLNIGGKAAKAGVVAINAADGETRWQATDHGASYATAVHAEIHGRPTVFVFTESGLVSIESRTGQLLWSIPFRSKKYESANATSPLVVGDVVMISATYGTGSLAVRILPDGSYRELWRKPFPDSHFSNILEVDGDVFGFAARHEADAEMFCCELATGRIRWRQATPFGRGQILRLASNELLVWGERGSLAKVELRKDRYSLICSTNPEREMLGHPTWTPPAVSNGRLFLRNEDTLLVLKFRNP